MRSVKGFGPLWLPHGGARFRLYAPACDRVLLRLESRTGARSTARPMERTTDGWHWLDCPGCEPGDRYAYDVGSTVVPDPASRFQPAGVHGPSELVDLEAYRWRGAWRGRPWHEAVTCELHVGAFSPEGTYEGVEARLDHLARTGYTAIELMPLSHFAGRRGWGYDGVLPFAPHAAYGPPSALQALVDAAHERGLMMLLDVVYNHFGPEGNHLPRYWPGLTNPHVHTPWGNAIDYDLVRARAVREFVIENARYWLREYRFDGLRLDAVHAIHDGQERSLLRELASTLRREFDGRELHLVLENDDNDARLLERESSAPLWYSAQWNDDVHHGLHVALTGEREAYYADYVPGASQLPRALAEGFAFQGERMEVRGLARGTPSGHLPWTAFIDFLQNHDQVGNRAFGERLAALAPEAGLRAAQAVLLLSPHVPLMFMGEEWGTLRPFLFFCDFDEPLATAVRDGRRREFAGFAAFADNASRERIPDPVDAATFEASRLDWGELRQPRARRHLEHVRRLLALRREQVMPWLAATAGRGSTRWETHGTAFVVRWSAAGRALVLRANLAAAPARVPAPGGTPLFDFGEVHDHGLGAWSVSWSWLDA